VKTIQKVVPEFVVAELRKKFGSKFFEQAVPKLIQKDCHNKRIDDDVEPQLPVETYLDWLQIRKIVEQKTVRDIFASTLSIQLEDENKGRHFYAAWFDQINEIRRISAHPAGRQYKEEDLEFLDLIYSQLTEKLPSNYFSGGLYAAVS
jgi:DNA sulfur modification protein DndB